MTPAPFSCQGEPPQGVLLCRTPIFQIFKGCRNELEGGEVHLVKNPFYKQNKGRLPSDPPNYLGQVAREVWRKVVPFLEGTGKVERIDTFLVESYCTNYEIYKLAYEDIKVNGIQQEIKKPVQAQGSGEILGEQSLGFKKNPAVATMKDATTTLNQIAMQLGLTPKGRAELLTIADSSKPEKSTTEMMKEFLNS